MCSMLYKVSSRVWRWKLSQLPSSQLRGHLAGRNTINTPRSVVLRFARYGFLVVIFLLNACSVAGNAQSAISFKPTLLPVKFIAKAGSGKFEAVTNGKTAI